MYKDIFSNWVGKGLLILGLVFHGAWSPAQEVVTKPLQQFRSGTLNTVVYSPNGADFAVAEGPDIYIWESDTLVIVQELHGHSAPVLALAYSPDGRYLLSGSEDHTARLWSASTGQIVWTLAGHTGPVNSVAFSPDGRDAVTGSADHTAIVWDVLTGTRIRTLEGHTLAVTSVDWSHNGQWILTGSWDNTTRLWDAATGALIHTFDGIQGPVAFSPDDSGFVAAGPNDAAERVDLQSQQVVQTYSGHAAPLTTVGFSPDGTRVVAASWDWTAMIWNTETGDRTTTFTGHYAGVVAARFSPDGSRVISVSTTPDNLGRIWDPDTADILGTFGGHIVDVYGVVFTPDGTQVIGNHSYKGIVDNRAKLWDIATGNLVRTFPCLDHSTDLALSRDGSTLMTNSVEGDVKLWQLSTGEVLRAIPAGAEGADLSPGGTVVATTGNATAVWDTATGNQILSIPRSGTKVAFSPQGDRLVTGNWESATSVFEIPSGRLLATLQVDQPSVSARATAFAFSPNGEYLAEVSDAATISLWNMWTFSLVNSFQADTKCVAFAPDGLHILTGSGNDTATLWDPFTGEAIRVYNVPGGSEGYVEVYGVAFSPDGSRIATGSSSGVIAVWDSGLAPVPVPAPLEYDFTDTAQAWQFTTAAPFTPPSSGYLPGEPGGLVLRSTNNTSTFGYWVSPLLQFGNDVEQIDPKPFSLQSPSESVYVGKFLVRSLVGDKSKVPQFRLRFSEDSGRQSNFMAVESGADGYASPGPGGQTYSFVFGPAPLSTQGTDEVGRLAFDLLNFDPQDDPSGDLEVDQVQISRHDLAELGQPTLLKEYRFTNGPDGWTNHSVPPFQSPVFGTDGEALTVSGPGPINGAPQVFGYWSSPEGDIPSFNQSGPVLYRATFEVESSLPEADRSLVPQFRLRLNDGTQHAASVLAIESKGDGGRSPVTGSPSTYVVYYVPPVPNPSQTQLVTTGSSLQASFDYANFDAGDDPSATLRLLGVTIEAVPLSW